MKKIGTSVALDPDIKEWADGQAKKYGISVGAYINALVFLDREGKFEIEAAHEGQKMTTLYGRQIGLAVYNRIIDRKRQEAEKVKKETPKEYVERQAVPAYPVQEETPPAVVDVPNDPPTDGQGRNEMI